MRERFLAGRVAMVTGGASGLGRAMALAFAREGAQVVIGSLLSSPNDTRPRGELAYLPAQDELDATAAEIESFDVACLAMGLDVTQTESVDGFYQAALQRFGQIDILATAAGTTAEQSICGHPDELWERVIDVNLHGTYRMVKRCLPGMIERGWGRIVNIASTSASVGGPTLAAYCASKAGVLGLMRSVALEGAPFGVTANAISPGWVETKFGRDWMSSIAKSQGLGNTGDDYIQATRAENPQGRLIQPSEIGALAAFLCREEAVGITMQNLTVSAGALW